MSAWWASVWSSFLTFLEIIGLREDRSASNELLLSVFKLRYREFRDLLTANNELLEIISDLEVLLRGDKPFGIALLRKKAIQAYACTHRMVECLQTISENRYPELERALERVEPCLVDLFSSERDPVNVSEWIVPLDRADRSKADHVGNKMANLAEIHVRLGLPTPNGFCITAAACRHFIEASGVADLIDERLGLADPENVDHASQAIREAILAAPISTDLSEALLAAYDALAAENVAPENVAILRVALRSSSAHEDSQASFAGQYATVLNVTREKLLYGYKQVVASFFTPRAIFYRRYLGVPDEEMDMGVGCVAMIDALASGVAFSRDPVDVDQDHVVIHAVWGLGPTLADGRADPDVYLVERVGRMPRIEVHVVRKKMELVADALGGVREVEVPEAAQDTPCLEPDEIRTLARWVLALEKHFEAPQDVEWALDHQRRLFLLQSRLLRQVSTPEAVDAPPVVDKQLLVDGGLIASPGVGHGPAVHMRVGDDLSRFPKGGVLVARNSSPEFVQIMDRAAAIVTDVGSTIGHMASLAREFHVPTLLGTRTATKVIPEGEEVTVDANWGRVYLGRVWELVADAPVTNVFMRGLPVFATLDKLADCIVPLNLTNPRSPDFAPENCQTLHDIARFAHERALPEMFGIGLLIDDFRSEAVMLDIFLPVDLYIIDLGGALDVPSGARRVKRSQIKSYPLAQLVRGMLHPGIPRFGPRAIDARGFASLIMRQALRNPYQERTFHDPCYAIASDRYLNFTARVGYHFSALDTYCGQSVSKNYISFMFAGGAADYSRRARRAQAIAEILEAIGFQVDLKKDRVDARITKREHDEIGHALEMVGRMFQFTRQMDVAMSSDSSVATLRDAFLSGNYSLDPNFKPPAQSTQSSAL